MVLLLALAMGGTVLSCREELPVPPDGPFPGAGGSGGTKMGGSTGTGGTPGAGGAGGMPAVDLRPADMVQPETPGGCGMAGEACCPGNECKDGGCCELGKCTPLGSACMHERDKASCFMGRCGGKCGVSTPPNPVADACCENRSCTAPSSTCSGDGRGTCVVCGGPTQPCCSNNYCKPGAACLGGICVPPR
jgi:hypothetical protein